MHIFLLLKQKNFSAFVNTYAPAHVGICFYAFSGYLEATTKMVLVNAVYFKGLWQRTFNSRITKDKDFWITSTEKVKTPMMHTEGTFKYSKSVSNLNASALILDYKVSVNNNPAFLNGKDLA